MDRRIFIRVGAGAAVAVPAVLGASRAEADITAGATAPAGPRPDTTAIDPCLDPDCVRTPLQVAQAIVQSVQSKVMPDVFAADAVYVPRFALPGAPQSVQGKDAILQYFAAAAKNPASGVLRIQELDPVYCRGKDPEIVVVELTVKGVNTGTGKPFSFNSSIGVLRVRAGRIVEWHDYSNTIGGSAAAGMLPQLIGALEAIAAH
ncbi:nuclear transport factor 2 family protein [Kitasatospora aureofaciens]|uniref:nuclear transport factor 2 family protein n=1 Tax=Kitasatospora aureofaciens TaxID=1894 RepID=UPI0037CB71FF